jgi:hypothetical protein
MLRAVLPLAAAVLACSAQAQPTAVTAYSPGAGFDQLSWQKFIEVVRPVLSPTLHPPLTFETWATDADTFTPTPAWPTTASDAMLAAHNERRFQVSALARARMHAPPSLTQSGLSCGKPGNAAAGNFPAPPTPTTNPTANCIAEEVRRNRDSFDYIVKNVLYTQAGLTTNYASSVPVQFPKPSIEIKIDWAPVDTVVAWINDNRGASQVLIGPQYVLQNFYVVSQGGVQYAFLSMHISSKDFQNWLWVTFEHQANPGRCDTMGCYDLFGVPASLANIQPHPQKVQNTRYPNCVKSPVLQSMFRKAGLLKVWDNYCLKDTQIDFVSNQPGTLGQPLLDGDSVIERITADVPIVQSSCITCHAYASFGKTGCVNFATNPGIQPQPTPAPVGNYTPQAGQKMYDFVWGLIQINDPAPC